MMDGVPSSSVSEKPSPLYYARNRRPWKDGGPHRSSACDIDASNDETFGASLAAWVPGRELEVRQDVNRMPILDAEFASLARSQPHIFHGTKPLVDVPENAAEQLFATGSSPSFDPSDLPTWRDDLNFSSSSKIPRQKEDTMNTVQTSSSLKISSFPFPLFPTFTTAAHTESPSFLFPHSSGLHIQRSSTNSCSHPGPASRLSASNCTPQIHPPSSCQTKGSHGYAPSVSSCSTGTNSRVLRDEVGGGSRGVPSPVYSSGHLAHSTSTSSYPLHHPTNGYSSTSSFSDIPSSVHPTEFPLTAGRTFPRVVVPVVTSAVHPSLSSKSDWRAESPHLSSSEGGVSCSTVRREGGGGTIGPQLDSNDKRLSFSSPLWRAGERSVLGAPAVIGPSATSSSRGGTLKNGYTEAEDHNTNGEDGPLSPCALTHLSMESSYFQTATQNVPFQQPSIHPLLGVTSSGAVTSSKEPSKREESVRSILDLSAPDVCCATTHRILEKIRKSRLGASKGNQPVAKTALDTSRSNNFLAPDASCSNNSNILSQSSSPYSSSGPVFRQQLPPISVAYPREDISSTSPVVCDPTSSFPYTSSTDSSDFPSSRPYRSTNSQYSNPMSGWTPSNEVYHTPASTTDWPPSILDSVQRVSAPFASNSPPYPSKTDSTNNDSLYPDTSTPCNDPNLFSYPSKKSVVLGENPSVPVQTDFQFSPPCLGMASAAEDSSSPWVQNLVESLQLFAGATRRGPTAEATVYERSGEGEEKYSMESLASALSLPAQGTTSFPPCNNQSTFQFAEQTFSQQNSNGAEVGWGVDKYSSENYREEISGYSAQSAASVANGLSSSQSSRSPSVKNFLQMDGSDILPPEWLAWFAAAIPSGGVAKDPPSTEDKLEVAKSQEGIVKAPPSSADLPDLRAIFLNEEALHQNVKKTEEETPSDAMPTQLAIDDFIFPLTAEHKRQIVSRKLTEPIPWRSRLSSSVSERRPLMKNHEILQIARIALYHQIVRMPNKTSPAVPTELSSKNDEVSSGRVQQDIGSNDLTHPEATSLWGRLCSSSTRQPRRLLDIDFTTLASVEDMVEQNHAAINTDPMTVRSIIETGFGYLLEVEKSATQLAYLRKQQGRLKFNKSQPLFEKKSQQTRQAIELSEKVYLDSLSRLQHLLLGASNGSALLTSATGLLSFPKGCRLVLRCLSYCTLSAVHAILTLIMSDPPLLVHLAQTAESYFGGIVDQYGAPFLFDLYCSNPYIVPYDGDNHLEIACDVLSRQHSFQAVLSQAKPWADAYCPGEKPLLTEILWVLARVLKTESAEFTLPEDFPSFQWLKRESDSNFTAFSATLGGRVWLRLFFGCEQKQAVDNV